MRVEYDVNIYNQLNRVLSSQHKNDLDLALRRLKISASRFTDSDHLVDCVTGLENLLIPEKGSEIGYKFKMRGAALLPDSFGGTLDKMQTMRELYKKRSEIVHGTTQEANIYTWSKNAEDIFRAILLWYISNWGLVKSRKEAIDVLDLKLIEGAAGFGKE